MASLLFILAALIGFFAFYCWLAWPGLAKQAHWSRAGKWLLFILSCTGFGALLLLCLMQLVQYPNDSVEGFKTRNPSAAQSP